MFFFLMYCSIVFCHFCESEIIKCMTLLACLSVFSMSFTNRISELPRKERKCLLLQKKIYPYTVLEAVISFTCVRQM